MAAIYRKELKIYFSGAFGFVLMALLLLFVGLFTVVFNLILSMANFSLALDPMKMVLVLVIPLLTMRSIAEERHSHTDQLLYSLPIRLRDIVLGKFFAMLTVFAVPTLITALYPLLLATMGSVSLAPAYTALFGYFLMGAALIALCTLLSSLVENQIVAVAISIGACLLLYLSDILFSSLPTSGLVSYLLFVALILIVGVLVCLLSRNLLVSGITVLIFLAPLTVCFLVKPAMFVALFPKFFNAINLFSRQIGFSYGYFDLGGTLFYLTVMILCLFFTVQSMELRRRG